MPETGSGLIECYSNLVSCRHFLGFSRYAAFDAISGVFVLQCESVVGREGLRADHERPVVVHIDRKRLNNLFGSLKAYEKPHGNAQPHPLASSPLIMRSELWITVSTAVLRTHRGNARADCPIRQAGKSTAENLAFTTPSPRSPFPAAPAPRPTPSLPSASSPARPPRPELSVSSRGL